MSFKEKASLYFSRIAKTLREKRVRAKARKSENLDRGQILAFKRNKIPSWKQLKYLREVLNAKERMAMQFFTGLLVVALIFLGGLWYFNHTAVTPAYGGEYTEGLIGTPQAMNPILPSANDVDSDLTHLIYSGLLKKNLRGEFVPDLAESFDLSADQKTYTFHLKKNIRWHDGEQFGIGDILFTIKMIQDASVKSPLHDSWRTVKAAAIDEQTVQIVLNARAPAWLENATVGILPEHLWNSIPISGFGLADLNLRPVGTGPYVFESFSRDRRGNIKSYTLTANQNYLPRPNIEKIIFKFFPDLNSAQVALNNRGIDAISFIGNNFKSQTVRHDLNYFPLQLPEYSALFFNTKNDLLKDSVFRAALALALDRSKLAAEALTGDVEPISSLFVNTPFAPPRQLAPPDLVKAAAILDKTDWKLGADGFRHKITITKTTKKVGKKNVTEETTNDQILSLVITTINHEENAAAAEFIKNSWEKIGIKTEIKLMSGDALKNDALKTKNYDILLYGEILGRDFNPFLFWHSSQIEGSGLNLSNYSNRTMDQLLEEAQKTSDMAVRADKYKTVDEIITRDVPAVFLWTPVYYYAIAKSFKGVGLTTLNKPSDRFVNISEWYTKTQRVWE